jgi:methyl-accepting chemotaxis protein
MPVTRQFTLLAIFGVVLTIAGMSLALQRSRDFAYEAKRAEIQRETEEGAAIVRHFVGLEQSGALTHAEAMKRAMEAVGAIRFEEVNYVAMLGFDGVSLVNANKNIVGKNIIDLMDPTGHPVTRAQLAVATSGTPGFAEFYWKKIGETTPKLKMSYNIGIPEWQLDVTSGDFVDDLDAALTASVIRLSEIFVPLFLGFLAIVFVMRRSLARLLGSLAGAMRELSQGNLATEIVAQDRRDEIGAMAGALVSFRQAAIDKVELEKRTESQREAIETERRSSEGARAASQNHQQSVVAALGAGLARLAKGDLTSKLDQPFAAEYEKLRADFNAAITSLQLAMQTIVHTTDAIHAGSDQIAGASDNLSRRTEQQAASLEETAAALSTITSTLGQMAANAGRAAEVVARTRGAAESSGDIVHEAVAAMGKIKESSQQITSIIGVIDEIAFQTNLLALNAGVEAARAGEAGRGFAVVASEVRGLAQRSAEAAKEIKALISVSTDEVESGVELVDRTGTALRAITEQVAAMDGLVQKISASSTEQATSLAEINTAVGQMDRVVQENAAMVEEATAAAHALKGDAQDLFTMVGRFDIGGDKGRVALRKRA